MMSPRDDSVFSHFFKSVLYRVSILKNPVTFLEIITTIKECFSKVKVFALTESRIFDKFVLPALLYVYKIRVKESICMYVCISKQRMIPEIYTVSVKSILVEKIHFKEIFFSRKVNVN